MRIRVVGKVFSEVGKAETKHVLGGIDVTIAPGEFAVVFGPSGCGKTTLLNIVAGLDDDFDGTVEFNLGTTPPASPRRAGSPPVIGYVFQNPRLLPWKTVAENVRLVVPPSANADERVSSILKAVGLADSCDVYPNRLSVGMARRVALARAFAVQPEILLMDEPFVSLDGAAATHLRTLLLRLLSERPTTVLFVTHDLGEAVSLADRILFLTPPPASVAADIPIPLRRDQRTDGALKHLLASLSDQAGAASSITGNTQP